MPAVQDTIHVVLSFVLLKCFVAMTEIFQVIASGISHTPFSFPLHYLEDCLL